MLQLYYKIWLAKPYLNELQQTLGVNEFQTDPEKIT